MILFPIRLTINPVVPWTTTQRLCIIEILSGLHTLFFTRLQAKGHSQEWKSSLKAPFCDMFWSMYPSFIVCL
ncbi:hypothetical protein M408DRAFT_142682 [Serendipita vermifera MAFF 305830]|uniref:Uncharacterized protein n=1 Tax=Serendipita vermifera MAFF 305830 TaxID=933852 RepID=A0A0C3B8L5_SERVB|nr:hypothetical protein M408DRAFT_142682 [Serendipita vermifera MAFF 305830]